MWLSSSIGQPASQARCLVVTPHDSELRHLCVPLGAESRTGVPSFGLGQVMRPSEPRTTPLTCCADCMSSSAAPALASSLPPTPQPLSLPCRRHHCQAMPSPSTPLPSPPPLTLAALTSHHAHASIHAGRPCGHPSRPCHSPRGLSAAATVVATTAADTQGFAHRHRCCCCCCSSKARALPCCCGCVGWVWTGCGVWTGQA